LSFSDSFSHLFALANLRRAVEGGDPSAVKTAAAMYGTSAAPAGPVPGATDTQPGTGSDANNQTAVQNPYASNMPAGAYGAPIDKATDTTFKPIGKTAKFDPSNFLANS